jgi:hypothetical protein
MGRQTARLLGMLVFLVAASASAQTPVLPPPAPVPIAPGTPLPPPPPSPLSYVPPPTRMPAPPTTDPGPNGWSIYNGPSPTEGFFVDAELALLFPAIKFRITNNMPLLPNGGSLRVPTRDLPLTLSPTLEIGYRLPDSCGFFAFSFRFLTDELRARAGRQPLAGANPSRHGDLQPRLRHRAL